jgi:hypothetical protein
MIAVMAATAALKLGDEFRRLVWDRTAAGALDLEHIHRWVHTWFSGAPLFQISHAALYPPATYLMLWPLLGWISFGTARWLWAVLFVVALALISLFAVRISGAERWRDKIFAALLFLSINGTGVAVGSGQLILILLPTWERLVGEILLIVNALVMLCPARFLDYSEYACSPPWIWVCTSVQAAVWLFTLAFLINCARCDPGKSEALSAIIPVAR